MEGGMTLRPRRFVLLVLLPLVLAPAAARAAKPGPEATPVAKAEPAKPSGAPVVLDGRTLFFVREGVMSFSPEDRAGAILRRLETFLKDPFARAESITVMEAKTFSEIVAGGFVLMTVTDRDAAAEGKPRAELANEYAEILRASARGHIEAYADRSVALGVAYGFLVTAALVAMLLFFKRLFPRLYSAADAWKGTRIRTIKNVGVTIPNSMILGSHIVNFNSSAKDHGLILNTGVTIGYDIDWRKVHELLISAARRTADILESPPPFVLQTSLNDFYVSYELNAYTEKPQIMERTYSFLHQNIQDAFNEAGVEIMSPHYGQIRDGNKTAIPDSYLPPEYVPGAIRVVSVPEGPPGKPEETRRIPTSS
jgi:hypothetical protein